MTKAKLLIVDDEPQNLQLMRQLLGQEYQLVFATDGERALEAVEKHHPDLILMDVMMPRLDGHQACRILKTNPRHSRIPVIFVTAMSDVKDEAEGFEAGGVDYIAKPVQASAVKRRVKTHLSLVGVDELESTRLQIIRILGRTGEYKTNESGRHAIRTSLYCDLIAEKIGKPQNWRQLIIEATPFHDIGKTGIPDHILLKTEPLDHDEWQMIKRHPEIGASIIGQPQSDLLEMARDIVLCHHEKWDGTGYPAGLSGETIPLPGRIAALADVFDVVTHRRPYQEAWPFPQALDLLRSNAGIHFDPDLVQAFLDLKDDLIAIHEKWPEI